MAKPSPKPKQTTAIDHGVGSRIAFLRAANGLSQSALASALGVSFQQVQKYETGKNRVGAGRLQAIAERLGVPVSSFFEPEPESTTENGPSLLRVSGAVELLRAYNQIADDQMRRDVLSLVKSAARIGQSRAAAGAAADQGSARDAVPNA
ncbi:MULTISPECIES: helix-turn-helix domain-containing protein [unclassified Methylobacterium]|jgi:transcriptional regulator with XRE-family HTH domain|uniref:helix-turn-helix domain-containing protein n=1 Tax=unclassified Methylobacterium TaxID=2615210 RepID=UPI001353FDC1|nr:helix-turn-helix transcriptional regulator [Methylobacterium sp. 2A]MWV21777.1 helix-turn-helix transcriptional regulator [Methylobacterium sp. 2A]